MYLYKDYKKWLFLVESVMCRCWTYLWDNLNAISWKKTVILSFLIEYSPEFEFLICLEKFLDLLDAKMVVFTLLLSWIKLWTLHLILSRYSFPLTIRYPFAYITFSWPYFLCYARNVFEQWQKRKQSNKTVKKPFFA